MLGGTFFVRTYLYSIDKEVIIMFITIVGAEYYLGTESLAIGQELNLKKDPDNRYDDESIKVETESGATCGHVANSVSTVARGSHSAGYIYNSINDNQKCKVAFILDERVIAELV